MDDNLTFGLTLTIVGSAGTMLSLWLLSFLIAALKKIYPLATHKTPAGGEKNPVLGLSPGLWFLLGSKNQLTPSSIYTHRFTSPNHSHQPLMVVWDGLPAHRSALVRDYIASLGGWIQIEYLPP